MANKKYSFQNKRKLFVSMFVFAFVAIAVAAAVVTVFALSQTNVTSSVRITYKAVGVVGKVEMYAKKGAEVESKIGEVEFAIDTTDTDDFSLVDKELEADETLVLHYVFTNTGSREYTAILNYNETDLNVDNMKLRYSQDGSTYNTTGYGLVVKNTEPKHYYVEISVDNKALDAELEGFFTWQLEKYEPVAGEELIKINAADYIDNKDGTFTAAYNGGDISIVPTVTSQEEGSPTISNLWYVANRIGSAPVTQIKRGEQFPENTKVVINKGIKDIWLGAFSGLNSLVEVSILSDIKSLADVFTECKNLIKVELPNTLESLGNTFYECSKLKYINLPNSLTHINGCTFQNCTSLAEITIPNNLKYIGEFAFWGCSSLEEVVLPNSVEYIGSSAFSGCKSLKNANIPTGIIQLNDSIFSGCTSLTEITIPTSVTVMWPAVFEGCSNLTSVIFENQIGWYYTPTHISDPEAEFIEIVGLEDLTTAATCLTDTYSNVFWKYQG